MQGQTRECQLFKGAFESIININSIDTCCQVIIKEYNGMNIFWRAELI